MTLSLLLVAGVCIAVYLARHHENQVYGDASLTLGNCPQTELVNCEAVNTSAWSELLGVPIAAFAVPTYLLVLGLLWAGRREPRLTSYAFGIGLLTALFSAFLLYISKVKVGFLCAWCLRLYGINVAIPVLAALIAWFDARGTPRVLAAEALRDLKTWPRPMRRAAAAFAALLVITIGAQQSYRAALKRQAVATRAALAPVAGPLPGSLAPAPGEPPPPTEAAPAPTPQAPAGQPGLAPPPVAPPPGAPPATGAFALPGPTHRLTAAKRGPRIESFDLQSRLGRGRPVALIFWSPGYWRAERGLVEIADYLKAAAPAFEVYAVAPPREGLPEAAALETFELLRVPASLPLLFDDGYKLAAALGVREAPDLVVFDRKGALVLSRVTSPRQKLETAAGVQSAAELLRAVAAGAEIPSINRVGPYYPGIERLGYCAPPFTLPTFESGLPYTFSGRPASGRTTLLLFWSSTCKHCQAEIPLLLDWLRAHPNRVDVVSITEIRSERPGQPSHRAITAAYIKQQQIPWLVLEDPDSVVDELYGTISTPTSFFISPRGAVTGVWLSTHGADLPAEMERELARASSAAGCAPGPPPAAAQLDLKVTDPAGRSVGLQSLLDKPALVHLWATWCAPCMKELPGLLRFRDRLEREGVGRVLFVSVEGEGDGAKIASFEEKFGMNLRSYRAPRGGLAEEVDPSYRVPRTFLVGPGGTLLGVRYGEQNWDDSALADRVISRLRNAPRAGM